jgi:DNA-binding transcriptional LysR family regulator
MCHFSSLLEISTKEYLFYYFRLQRQLLDRSCAKIAHVDMPRSLPPLNALRAFEAAGRHSSFSRAAEELGVSHSSISRHVRGLEQRLGVQLFRDAARGVELSTEGRAYLGQITPAFDVISEATETMTGRAPGIVTISCEPVFATHWLAPRLGEFAQAFPEIEPRVRSSGALANLSGFEADLAIRSVIDTEPEQPAVLISNAPFYPYGHPDTFNWVKSAEDLLRCKRFQDRRGDPWRNWFQQAGLDEDRIPAPDWRMQANLALEMTLSGQGVILITDEVVARHVDQGRLKRLVDVPFSDGSYQILAEPQALRRRAVRQFRDWVVETGAPFRS